MMPRTVPQRGTTLAGTSVPRWQAAAAARTIRFFDAQVACRLAHKEQLSEW